LGYIALRSFLFLQEQIKYIIIITRDAIRDLEVPVIDVTRKTQPRLPQTQSLWYRRRTLAAGLQCRFVISDSI
jgi:hypothetical protein